MFLKAHCFGMYSAVKTSSSPITFSLLIDEKITSKSLTVEQVQEVSQKQQLCFPFVQLSFLLLPALQTPVPSELAL